MLKIMHDKISNTITLLSERLAETSLVFGSVAV